VKTFATRLGLLIAAIALIVIGIVVIDTPLGYIFHVKDFPHPKNMFETILGWFALVASMEVAVRFYRIFASPLCKPKPVTSPPSHPQP